jgi:hypothetical protein
MKVPYTFLREILAYGAVILVLVVLILSFPPFGINPSGVGLKGPNAVEMSRLKWLGLACKRYASDNKGQFPPKLEDLFPRYVTDRKDFICKLPPNESEGVVYTPSVTESSPRDTVLIRERYSERGLWKNQVHEIQVYVDDSARILKVDQ